MPDEVRTEQAAAPSEPAEPAGSADARPAAPGQPLAIRSEKRVEWVELLFDLVFVFAVTQVAARLGQEPTWHGVLAAFAAFTPFWWSWVGTAVLANSADMTATVNRLRVFAIGGCSLVMTVAVPSVFDGGGWLFACAYAVLRTVLLQWWFAGVARRRWAPSPFTWSSFVTAPLLLVTVPLDGDAQVVAWAVVVLGELASSTLFRARLARLRINVTHMPERFGLVVIIALGETVVAAAAGLGGHLDPEHVVALLLAWVLVCGLWWLYFAHSAAAIAYALETAESPSRVVRWIFSYGHYGLTLAVIAIAVALEHVVHSPGGRLHGEQWLLCGGTALYLAVFTWQRWLMFRTVSPTRAPAAAAALLLGVVASFGPGMVGLALVAALVAGLAPVEAAVIRRARRAAA